MIEVLKIQVEKKLHCTRYRIDSDGTQKKCKSEI